jgi:ABC-type Fe3+ transport system substrate-binding protein
MTALERAGRLAKNDFRLYLHNRLSLMVPPGNPGQIRTVRDLGGDAIRVSQPDPANEDIAFHIIDMYRDAGGEPLVHRIMEEKRAEGTTIYTVVHHRETPVRITKGTVDVGPVWATEVAYARQCGTPVESIAPGAGLDQRNRINYYVGRLSDARHPDNADRFVDFICSREGQAIYSAYGFLPAS